MSGILVAFYESNLLTFAASFPYKIGYDCSGIVAAVGSNVKNLNIGDAVFCVLPITNTNRGSFSEYAIADARTTALKPKNLSHIEAASMPLVGLTALECLEYANKTLPGGLQGKTVLIPAGLSGTGSIAIQLAMCKFEVAKVITTLSTGKMEKAVEYFGHEAESGTGGNVKGEIQYIDYKKEDILQKVPKGSVDFLLENQNVAGSYLPLMKEGGCIVSIAGMPSSTDIPEYMTQEIPTIVKWGVNAVYSALKYKYTRAGVSYKYIFMTPTHEMMETLRKLAEQEAIKPLVGRYCNLDDIEELREACQEVYDGKGGIGKFAVEVWHPNN